MGLISLSLPSVGQLNSTEEPKIPSDFTILQNVINGNLDTNNLSASAAVADTQLASPNNSYRKLLLFSEGFVNGGMTVGNYLLTLGNQVIASGGQPTGAIPLWAGDAGYSSQPQDFQVAGKTAFARIRTTVVVNGTGPGVTLTSGLYPLTSIAGGSGAILFSFGSVVASSTAAVASPSAGSITTVESAQFSLPSSATAYALGVALSGTTAAASYVGVNCQMFGYNA